MSFTKFVSEIKNRGIARSSHYLTEITPPPCMGVDPSMSALIPLFCEQAMFPEMVLATQPIKDNGRTREVVYDKMYGQQNMSFYCDSDMIIKTWFDTWLYKIIRHSGGIFEYPRNYMTTIKVHQVNEKKEIVYTATMYKAYPKIINDVILSAQSNDISRFQVQFVYERCVIESTESSDNILLNSLQSLSPQFLNQFNSSTGVSAIKGTIQNKVGMLTENTGGLIDNIGGRIGIV